MWLVRNRYCLLSLSTYSFLSSSKKSLIHVPPTLFVFLRVQPGHCYHLYNGLRASLLDDYQLPEILRTPLEELCLQIKVN